MKDKVIEACAKGLLYTKEGAKADAVYIMDEIDPYCLQVVFGNYVEGFTCDGQYYADRKSNKDLIIKDNAESDVNEKYAHIRIHRGRDIEFRDKVILAMVSNLSVNHLATDDIRDSVSRSVVKFANKITDERLK